jgi:hypothetical protein
MKKTGERPNYSGNTWTNLYPHRIIRIRNIIDAITIILQFLRLTEYRREWCTSYSIKIFARS